MTTAAQLKQLLPVLPGALCAEVDAEMFFPEKGESPKLAKRVCGMCDVRAECLAWALENDEDYWGIWGGLSAQERRKLKRGKAA